MIEKYRTFKFTPKGDVKRTIHYLDRTIDFESGAFQVQRVGVHPTITFECNFEGTGKSLRGLEEFYLKHGKHTNFYFWYDKKRYTVKFTSDYVPTDTWGWDGNCHKIIGKVAVTLTMRVVYE